MEMENDESNESDFERGYKEANKIMKESIEKRMKIIDSD